MGLLIGFGVFSICLMMSLLYLAKALKKLSVEQRTAVVDRSVGRRICNIVVFVAVFGSFYILNLYVQVPEIIIDFVLPCVTILALALALAIAFLYSQRRFKALDLPRAFFKPYNTGQMFLYFGLLQLVILYFLPI